MPLKICVFEDSGYQQFYPLTHLRPVYTMRAGILPLFRRAERFFTQPNISLVARHQLAPLVAGEFRDYPVNIIKREEQSEVLFLNGRIRDFGDLPRLVMESRLSTAFRSDNQPVAVLFKPDTITDVPLVATPDQYMQAFVKHREQTPNFDTSATLYGYCWEIMSDIEREISADFEFLKPSLKPASQTQLPDGSHIIKPERVSFGDGITVKPGSVIDATDGPICIGPNTRIESQAAICGPCHIGANSVVVAGKIAASSIGHTCRVGGEVEETIFQSYVNKYHAGFIGHSYVGSWVNFGAMTTNSDLKNNYSDIRVNVNGESIDTGSIKVGAFIGDHTKFGIGTLLNTGINIGVCCNIFGGGLVADKEIPSFRWGNSSGYDTYQFEKAIDMAVRTMGRRNVMMSDKEKAVLRLLFDNQTSDEGVLEFSQGDESLYPSAVNIKEDS